MKKRLLIIPVVVCCFVMSFMLSSSAAGEIVFNGNPSADNTDGGYYAKAPTFTATSNSNNGVTVSDSTGDRCLWAFTNEVIEANPYLYYTLADDGVVIKMTASKNWDVEPEIDLDITPGTHCLNIKEILAAHETTVGYSYIVVYASGETNIDNFYLSSVSADAGSTDTGSADTGSADTGSGDSDSEDVPTPDTFDGAIISGIIFIAVATAAVSLKKRR